MQHIEDEMHTKEHVTKHRLLLEQIHEFKSLGILGFKATQLRIQGGQEVTSGPGRPRQRHAPEEKVGRYRGSSITPVFPP